MPRQTCVNTTWDTLTSTQLSPLFTCSSRATSFPLLSFPLFSLSSFLAHKQPIIFPYLLSLRLKTPSFTTLFPVRFLSLSLSLPSPPFDFLLCDRFSFPSLFCFGFHVLFFYCWMMADTKRYIRNQRLGQIPPSLFVLIMFLQCCLSLTLCMFFELWLLVEILHSLFMHVYITYACVTSVCSLGSTLLLLLLLLLF